jgi:hypothetical protein
MVGLWLEQFVGSVFAWVYLQVILLTQMVKKYLGGLGRDCGGITTKPVLVKHF